MAGALEMNSMKDVEGNEPEAPEGPKMYMGVPLEDLIGTPEHGLTEAEAAERLEKFGKNEVEERTVHPLVKLAKSFIGPMPIMIWVAIIIEGAMKHWPDFGILFALQLLNSFVGWYEELKAGNAVAALKAALKPEAYVVRGGESLKIDATLLVPGDIVLLAAGAAVPADCKILESEKPVQADQAALTGESLPVTLKGGDDALMGSTITRGESLAVVTATGVNTFFGRTADMIQSVHEMGHFQKIILYITMTLLIISILFVASCLGYLLSRGMKVLEAISFCVVLLVASIPIAMAVVTTATMALGSKMLAKEKAIVTRLTSIEELASMNMLCSDKTGTLTANKMELQEELPTFTPGVTREDVLKAACLAARWKEPPKDALDTLCLNSYPIQTLDVYDQYDFTPFDPSTKYTAAKLKGPDGAAFEVMKGAPQVVLDRVTNVDKAEVAATIATFASRGIRALAVAQTDKKGKWGLLGILTFLDPPRHDTKETIERAHDYGVDVKMITGDQQLIAIETCRMLGMGTTVLTAECLPSGDETFSKELGKNFGELCENADGFAEVYPEHKYAIVETLRQRGFMCGMTGDGVNDAPALKRADVGVAVEGATDAARAAADIVLTAPGLSAIVEGIILSRQIFRRMKNYVLYRIAMTLQLLLFFFIAVLALDPQGFPNMSYSTRADRPGDTHCARVDDSGTTVYDDCQLPGFFELPVMALVIVTILNDGCMISIAYDRVKPSKTPESWGLIEMTIMAFAVGLPIVLASLLMLYFGMDSSTPGSAFQKLGIPVLSYLQVQNMIYLQVSLAGFLTIFAARTKGPFFLSLPGWQLLLAGAFSMLASTLLARYWAEIFDGAGLDGGMDDLPWDVVGGVWVYGIVWLFIQDCSKIGMYEIIKRARVPFGKMGSGDSPGLSAFKKVRMLMAQEGLSVKQGAPDIQAMKEEYSTRLTNRGMSAAGLGTSREASKRELANKLAILQEEISSVKIELSKL